MYKFLDSKEEIEGYIKLEGITSAIELCEHKLDKHFNAKVNKKHIAKMENFKSRIAEDIKFKYYEVYKRYFKLPKMIDKYYDSSIFTKERVQKAMILDNGRNFEDGFSGIKVKNNSYTNNYVVEVVDGERGQVFCKRYEGGLPTKEQIIIDSVFGLGELEVREQGNLYSIYDFFN